MSQFSKDPYGLYNPGQPAISGLRSPLPQSSPPIFLERLVSRNIIREGDPLLLIVRVAGSPAPRVTWFHADTPIQSSADFRLRQDGDSYSLHIREVFREDGGSIRVLAENSSGAVQCATDLVIKVPDDSSIMSHSSHSSSKFESISWSTGPRIEPGSLAQPPQFSKPLRDIQIGEGEGLRMECQLPPYPPPDNVQWFRNGLEVRPSTDYVISFRQGVCSLSIAEIFAEDSGNYTCSAFYGGVKVTTSMNLLVVAPSTTTSGFLAPVFDKPMTDLLRPLGSTAHFECHVIANLSPEIVWSRRGRPMLDQTRYSSGYDQSTGMTSLTIRDVTRDDEGEYTCEALNMAGEASTTSILRTVAASSISSGPPPPQPPARSQSVSSTHTAVSIESLSPCSRKQKFDLSLFEKKLLQDKTPLSGGSSKPGGLIIGQASAPRFTQKPENIDLKKVQEVSFQCIIQGNPQPNVQWFHNGRQIRPSDHYKMFVSSEGECKLRIINHSADDTGYYTCCITNSIGREVCSAKLTVDGSISDISPSNSIQFKRSSVGRTETTERSQRSSQMTTSEATLVSSTSEPVILEHLCDVRVREGEPLTLSVTFAGLPVPQVTWHKDGRLIDSRDGHYRLEQDAGVSTICADTALLSDSGVYVCTAVNVKGVARSEARLTVEGASKAQSNELFYSRSTLSRASVDPCSMLEKHSIEESYRRSSVDILSQSSFSSDKFGRRADKEVHSTPRFTSHLKPAVSVVRNDSASFQCNISPANDPSVKVEWFKDGQQIVEDGRMKTSWSNGTAVLEIRQVTPQDSGVFICKASNTYGSVSSHCRLQCTAESVDQKSSGQAEVQEEFSIERRQMIKTTEAQSKPSQKPLFTRSLSSVCGRKGQTIRFEVEFTSDPDPQILWLLNGFRVQESKNSQIISCLGKSSLTIRDLSTDSCGTYTVQIRNSAGSAESTADVKLTDEASITKKSYPVFLEVMRDEAVSVGSAVLLRCEVVGQPRPDVHWTKNGQRLTPGGRYRMNNDRDVYTLSVDHIEMNDSAIYECIASNPEGYATCRAQLSIKAGTNGNKSPPLFKTNTNAPKFLMTLNDIRCNAGSSAAFEVTVRGQPDPEVRWFYRGQALNSSDNFQIAQEGERYRLTVKHASRQTSGIYTCRAINRNGSAETCAELFVTGEMPLVGSESSVDMKPEFIKTLQDVTVKDGDETLLTCQIAGKPIPAISWLHNNENIDLSKDYTITYNKETGHISLGISDCLPEDEGRFTCTASNPAGRAETSCKLTVVPGSAFKPTDIVGKPLGLAQKLQKPKSTKPTKPMPSGLAAQRRRSSEEEDDSGSPRFTQPVQPFITYEGEGFVLEAVVVGRPEPDVVWLKGKEELPVMGGRHTVMFDRVTGTCSLVVREAQASDAGVYSCQAVNGTGKAISTANVVVVPVDAEVTITDRTRTVKKEIVLLDGKQEMHIVETSPSFKQPLKPVYEVELGQSITLETFIESNPQPTVVWLFNGSILKESENIFFSHQRNKLQLIVRKCTREHAGEYTCRVSNKLGESSCNTTLKTTGVRETEEEHLIHEVHREIKQEIHKSTSTTQTIRNKQRIIIEEPPRFIKSLSNQTGYDGKPMMFRVQYVGMPPICITWFYNGQPIESNGDFRITHRPKVKASPDEEDIMESCLTIAEVFPDDDGEYTCKAESSLGAAVTHCHFTVLREDNQQSMFTSEEQLSQHVIQKEPRRFSETIAIDNRPQLDEMSLLFQIPQARRERAEVSLRSTSIPRGQRMEVEIEPPVTQSQQKIVALKQRAEAIATQRHEIMIPIVQQRSFSETFTFIKTAQKEARDSRQKVSTQHMTLAQPKGTLVSEVGIDEERQKAQSNRYEMFLNKFLDTSEEDKQKNEPVLGEGQQPRFTNALHSQKVMDGEEVKFTCTVKGNPAPEVSWYHDDKPITDNPDFKMKYDKESGQVELLIVEVFPQDTGLYNCVASNKYGRAVNTAQLTVEEYEYIPDTEEAGTTSQAESSVYQSMDEGEFQLKSQNFLDNASKRREEDQQQEIQISTSLKQESKESVTVTEKVENVRQRGTTLTQTVGGSFEETVLMADVKWQKSKQVAPHTESVSVEEPHQQEAAKQTSLTGSVEKETTDKVMEVMCVSRVAPTVECAPAQELDVVDVSQMSPITMVTSEVNFEKPVTINIEKRTMEVSELKLTVGGINENIQETLSVKPVNEASELICAAEVPLEFAESSLVIECLSPSKVSENTQPAEKIGKSSRSVPAETLLTASTHPIVLETCLPQQGIETASTGEFTTEGMLSASEVSELKEKISASIIESMAVETNVLQDIFQTATEMAHDATEELNDSASLRVEQQPEFLEAMTSAAIQPSDDSSDDTYYDALERSRSRSVNSSASDSDVFEPTHLTDQLEEGLLKSSLSESTLVTSSPDLQSLAEFDSSEQLNTTAVEQTDSASLTIHDSKTETTTEVKQTVIETSVRQTEVIESSAKQEEVQSPVIEVLEQYSQIASPLVEATTTSEAEVQIHQTQNAPKEEVRQLSEEDLKWFEKQFEENVTQDVIQETTHSEEAVMEVKELSPPQFITNLSDVTTFDGARTVLTCRVTGHPTPSATWFVDGELIRVSPDFQVLHQEDGTCCLIIQDTLMEDEGEYTVRATNELGENQTSAYLTVLPKESKDSEQLKEAAAENTSATQLKVEETLEASSTVSSTLEEVAVVTRDSEVLVSHEEFHECKGDLEQIQTSVVTDTAEELVSKEEVALVTASADEAPVLQAPVLTERSPVLEENADLTLDQIDQISSLDDEISQIQSSEYDLSASETSTKIPLELQFAIENTPEISVEEIQQDTADIIPISETISSTDVQQDHIEASNLTKDVTALLLTEMHTDDIVVEEISDIEGLEKLEEKINELETAIEMEESSKITKSLINYLVQEGLEKSLEIVEIEEMADNQPTEEKANEENVPESVAKFENIQSTTSLLNTPEDLLSPFESETFEDIDSLATSEQVANQEDIQTEMEKYENVQKLISTYNSLQTDAEELALESMEDIKELSSSEETVQENSEPDCMEKFEAVQKSISQYLAADSDVEIVAEENVLDVDDVSSLEANAIQSDIDDACAKIEDLVKSAENYMSKEIESEQIALESTDDIVDLSTQEEKTSESEIEDSLTKYSVIEMKITFYSTVEQEEKFSEELLGDEVTVLESETLPDGSETETATEQYSSVVTLKSDYLTKEDCFDLKLEEISEEVKALEGENMPEGVEINLEMKEFSKVTKSDCNYSVREDTTPDIQEQIGENVELLVSEEIKQSDEIQNEMEDTSNILKNQFCYQSIEEISSTLSDEISDLGQEQPEILPDGVETENEMQEKISALYVYYQTCYQLESLCEEKIDEEIAEVSKEEVLTPVEVEVSVTKEVLTVTHDLPLAKEQNVELTNFDDYESCDELVQEKSVVQTQEADNQTVEVVSTDLNENLKQCPIAILTQLTDVSPVEGETFVMSCELSQPELDVTWLYGDVVVTQNERIEIRREEKVYTLVIRSCTASDTGSYTIRVDEAIQSSCSVNILVAPKITLDTEISEQGLIVRRGQTATLSINCISNPAPTLNLTSSSKLDSSRVSCRIIAESKILFEIKEARKDDEQEFVIEVTNKAGKSSKTIKVTVLAEPSEPRNICVDEISETSCQITYDKPERDGGSPILGYIIEFSANHGSTWTRINTELIQTLSYQVTNLSAGKEYSIRVSAVNDIGTGGAGYSDQFSTKQIRGVPGRPDAPKVLQITEKSARIQWKAPESDGGDAINGYLVEYKKFEEEDWSKQTACVTDMESFTITGLVGYTKYVFRVTAENSVGYGESSTHSEAMYLAEPSEPRNIRVDEISETSCQITYDMPERDGGSSILGYILEYSANHGSTWTRINTELIQTLSYQITNLSAGKEYSIRVSAVNDIGTGGAGYSDQFSTKQLRGVPGRPDPPKILQITENSARVQWKAPESDGGDAINGYLVEYKKFEEETWSKQMASVSDMESFTITGLVGYTKYVFRATAGNSVGYGEPSNPSEAVHLAEPSEPRNIRVDEISETSCQVTYERPERDGGSAILGYILDYSANHGSTWTRINTELIQTLSYQVTNLSAGKEYSIRVSAVNDIGTGGAGYSDQFSTKQPRGVPARPDPPKVLQITENSAKIQWKAPESDGGDAINGYIVEYKKFEEETWSKQMASVTDMESFTVTGLVGYTKYVFRATAGNSVGYGEPSNPSESAEFGPPKFTTEHSEETIQLISGSSTSLRLPYRSALPPSCRVSRKEEILVHIEHGQTLVHTERISAVLMGDTVELNVVNVEMSDADVYKVSLESEQGQTFYDINLTVLDKPGPPKDLQIKSCTDSSVTLTWLPPDFDGGSVVSSYLVEVKASTSESWEVSGRVGCLELTVDSLQTGATYSFRVAAENKCGLGQYVNLIDSVTLRAAEPARMKPWFIRKLPSRIEIVEGETFQFVCYTGERGMKPYFVKKLPIQMEAQRGTHFEAECVVGSGHDPAAVASSRSAAALKRRSSSLGQRAKPTAPAALRLTDLTPTNASISWERPADCGGAPLIHYILEKREVGQAEWEVLTNLPPDINECDLENMISNKGYYLRISAENKYGVSVPRELGEQIIVCLDDIPLPGKPQGVKVSPVGEKGLEVTWDPVESHPEAPVLQYVVETREMRGPRWVRVSKVTVDTPPYVLENRVDGSDYEFRVFARNCLGLSEPSDVSKQFKSDPKAEDPARFVVELKNVMVDAGCKAEFECVVAGNPAPQVKWFKNMREIFDGYRHKIQQDEDCCRLVFHSVLQDDCGEVECRVFNSAGLAVSRAILSINAPAQLMLNPRFMHGLSFTSGQPMKIHVPIMGSPAPDVTWSRDGEPIKANERRSLAVDEQEAVLEVRQCSRREDAGQYSLRVRNNLGTDQASFVVTIIEPPEAPQGRPVVKQISSDSCRLDWEAPGDDGGASVTSYLVEKREVPPASAEQDMEKGWHKVGSTHFTHMIVYRLIEGTRYEFRVRAENSQGLSGYSQITESILIDAGSSEMNYDALVFPESHIACKKVDVTKLKGEADLNSKYIICEELGRGSFGVVHRAIERSTGKNCLAKFVACTTIERAMVRQELSIMADLQHHCLQHLQEAYETTGEIAFMLEFVSGSDLLSRISQSDQIITELDCIHWMREICQGVAHMHKNNIIHLDLRAENIYNTTSKSQDIKILNFGIAQRVDPDRTVRVLLSTIEYCSPEILTFAPVSFSSDMWSLGVLAFVLLSGISPFSGKTVDETYLNITEGKGVSFSDPVWKSVSHYAKNWIGKLVIKDTKKRMTVAEALADPWLNGEAEAKITSAGLSTKNHKLLLGKQHWRKSYKNILPVGSLAHEGAVFLKLSQEGIAMERELFMELPDKIPEVVIELSNTEAYEGTVGRFKCKFHSQPEATVQWYHEEYALDADNPKYNVWYKHGLAMLNICDVDMEDCGQYSCVATNRLGSCTTVGELNIQEQAFKRTGYIPKRRRSVSFERDSSLTDLRRSLSTERQTSLDRSLSSMCGQGSAVESFSSGYASYSTKVAPQFLLPLMDQTAVVGQACTLTVLMSLKPDVEVSWFHGQTKLSPSAAYQMNSDSNNSFSLTITSVTVEDAGQWRCLGVNSYGQCMCVCNLQVLDEIPEGCVGPKCTQPLVKTIVMEGGASRLECNITGTPQPEVQWFRDRKLIGDDPFYMISCDEKEIHTLFIPATYSEHAGWYTCQARNVAGSVTTEAKLVVERIDCESLISTQSSFDRASLTDDLDSVHTRTTTGSAQRRKKILSAPPQFTARLRPKRCQEGQSVRFNCSVSGIPDPTISWQRANGTVILPSSRVKISNNYGLCSLEMTRIRREDAGLITVTATNSEGEVTSSATLDVEPLSSSSAKRHQKCQSFDMDWLKSASEDEEILVLDLPDSKPRYPSDEAMDVTNAELKRKSQEEEKNVNDIVLRRTEDSKDINDDRNTASQAKSLETFTSSGEDSKPVTESTIVELCSPKDDAIKTADLTPSASKSEDFESTESKKVESLAAYVPVLSMGSPEIMWADDAGAAEGSDTEVPTSDEEMVLLQQPLPNQQKGDEAEKPSVSAEADKSKVEAVQVSSDQRDVSGQAACGGESGEEVKMSISELLARIKSSVEAEDESKTLTDSSEPKEHTLETSGTVSKETGVKCENFAADSLTESKTQTEIVAQSAEKIELRPEPKQKSAGNFEVRDILGEIERRAADEENMTEDFLSKVTARIEESLKDDEDEQKTEGSEPRFVELLKDQTVSLGSVASFSCVIESETRPTVVWLKDGQLAKSRSNVSVTSQDGGRHVLAISSVSIEDAGEYVVDVMNRFGSASSSAILSISTSGSSAEITSVQTADNDNNKNIESSKAPEGIIKVSGKDQEPSGVSDPPKGVKNTALQNLHGFLTRNCTERPLSFSYRLHSVMRNFSSRRNLSNICHKGYRQSRIMFRKRVYNLKFWTDKCKAASKQSLNRDFTVKRFDILQNMLEDAQCKESNNFKICNKIRQESTSVNSQSTPVLGKKSNEQCFNVGLLSRDLCDDLFDKKKTKLPIQSCTILVHHPTQDKLGEMLLSTISSENDLFHNNQNLWSKEEISTLYKLTVTLNLIVPSLTQCLSL